MVERVIRTLIEQCLNRHHFESLQHGSREKRDWIDFYKQRRRNQVLEMKTPAEGFKINRTT